MFPRYRLPLLLLIAWVMSACTLYIPMASPEGPTALPATPSGEPVFPTSMPTITVSSYPDSTSLSTPVTTPATADQPLRTQYDLRVQFDYTAHTLAVSEVIHYTNQTGEALSDLLLVVHPLRWRDSFNLTTMTWADGTPITEAQFETYLLRIPLIRLLEAGVSIELRLSYQLNLPEISPPEMTSHPQPYGYTERQTNVADWYPYLPPYQPGIGWLAHEPGRFGEYLVYDLADYQVQINLVVPISGLVIAASAPAIQDEQTYTFSLPAARTFVWSASPQYRVLTQTVGGTTVSSYYFPYHATAGQAVLEATAQALVLYNELLGEYPRPSLSAVAADFQDGMEYSGLYFISRGFYDLYDGTPRGYLSLIAAHETAHQWWFDQVGNNQALEPWLDEALCTYMERLYFERLDAENPPGNSWSFVDWWWYFRVDFYAPGGWMDGTIYDYDSSRAYRDAVYLRGAQFLEALRLQMGDEAFFAFLRAYATRMDGQLAGGEDFFNILGEYAEDDLSGIREGYFSP